jgi:hypothetical protein
MTVRATHTPRRPVSHAFVVPVVREPNPGFVHTVAGPATW